MSNIVLASSSPRRRELLSKIDIPFTIKTKDFIEEIDYSLPKGEIVKNISFQKAKCVQENNYDIYIAADTIVVLDEKILTKPKDFDDAVDMLKKLSGKAHYVYTGVCILKGKNTINFYEKTLVEFYDICLEDILKYVNSGEPLDKAGSYGIQDFGATFVKRIEGDFYNVMGLPLSKVYYELNKLIKKDHN